MICRIGVHKLAKKNRGGARKGSGPKPKENKKLPYSTKLAPDIIQFLRRQKNAAGVIDSAIRNSDEFKAFSK